MLSDISHAYRCSREPFADVVFDAGETEIAWYQFKKQII